MTGYLGILANDAQTRFGTIEVDGAAVPLITDNIAQLDPQATYAVMTIVPEEHSRKTLGTPSRYRVVGDVVVDLLVPVASGEDTIQAMADEVTSKFLDVSTITDGHTIRYTPAPTFVGLPVREDSHWLRSMRLPFLVDYFR